MMNRSRLWVLLVTALACITLLAAGNQDKAAPGDRQRVEDSIEASIDEVWNAMTTQAGLKSWLAPHVEIDLRIGGTWKTNYNPQGKIGDPDTIVNTILSYDPQRMLSIKVAKAPAGFPFPDAIKDMWTVMYFSETAPRRTKVTVVGLGYTDTEESRAMREFFTAGNAHTLAMLKAALASRK